jgi:hypothetical protein
MAYVEYRLAPFTAGRDDVDDFLSEWKEGGWRPDGPAVQGRDLSGHAALMYTMRRQRP